MTLAELDTRPRDWRTIPRKDLTLGDLVVGFIETYCRIPEGKHVSQPLRLDEFQKRFIYDVFDNPAGTRRGILSVARKNGKSALIAAILVAGVCGPLVRRNAQICSGARSKDQAALVFDLAAKMIGLSEELSRLVKVIPSTKTMIGKLSGVTFRALAADSTTAMGKSPAILILDELGQVTGPTDPFSDALMTAQGAYDDALQLCISTQAAGDGDMLSIMIDDALRGEDPTIVCHLYTAPTERAGETLEITDRQAYEAANPGLDTIRSRRDLELQLEEAMRLPSKENSVRNLLLNQRVQSVSPFLSPSVWDACDGEIDPALFYDGRPVVGGLDLSLRTDLTALVLACRDDDGRVHLLPFVWTPADTLADRGLRDRAPYLVWRDQGLLRAVPGMTINYDFVAADIMLVTAGMNVIDIGFDRWRISIMRQALAEAGVGITLAEVGQGYKDMSPAIDAFEARALELALVHGGNPVLRWAIANCVVEMDPAGNRKLAKNKSFGRIDPAVAAVMAIRQIDARPEAMADAANMIA